jgi:hypothetical protein
MWVYWRASRCLGEFAASSVPIFEQQPAYWAGPLPTSLYNMKMLKEICLPKNELSGQLSLAIGQLQHLTKLSISMNIISGGFPIELGSVQYLEFLYL